MEKLHDWEDQDWFSWAVVRVNDWGDLGIESLLWKNKLMLFKWFWRPSCESKVRWKDFIWKKLVPTILWKRPSNLHQISIWNSTRDHVCDQSWRWYFWGLKKMLLLCYRKWEKKMLYFESENGKNGQLKYRFFLWLAIQICLCTRDFLLDRYLLSLEQALCPFWASEIESADHLLFQCYFAWNYYGQSS